MSHLLLIDGEPEQLEAQVRQAFHARDHRIEVARTGTAGVARLKKALPRCDIHR